MFLRISFFICFLFASFFVNAQNEIISLENFAKKHQFLDIKISPTGKYIAATSQEDTGNVSLTVIEISSNKVLSNQHLKGKDTIRNFYWANEERIVFEIARIVGALDMPSFMGELYAVNADGSRPITLTGPRAKEKEYSYSAIEHLMPDEKNYILISSSPYSRTTPFMHLRKLNIYNGRVSPVTKMPIKSTRDRAANLILDNNGVARIAMGLNPVNDQELLMLYRENDKDDWQQISKTHIDDKMFIPYAFLADNKTLAGISNTQTDTNAIATFNPATLKQEIIAHHPAVDLQPVFNLVKGVPDSVIGASYNYEASETIIFDDANDAFSNVLRSLIATFKGSSVSITSTTQDEKMSVVRVSGTYGGSDFYIFNHESKKLSYLLNSAPWLKKDLMPETTGITYKSRDGLTIHAVLTLPKGVDAKDLPLIMLPHGGPHGIRDYVSYDPDAKVLASHGYAVLQPNFRGSGGFGQSFLTAGYQNWGTTMINDMTDGVHHLVNQGMVDKNRICTYGASYGGYAALQSAIREPELYKCVVGFVGVFDLNLMYTDGDIPERESGVRYLEKVIGKDKAQLDAQSPLKNLDKLKAPVFIVHGGKDERVPIIHANRLKEELEKRNHPYEWLVKDEEGHGFYKPEHNVERWQKMLSFFEQHIGTKTH